MFRQSFVESKFSTGYSSKHVINNHKNEKEGMNIEAQHPLVYITVLQSRNTLEIVLLKPRYK